MGENAATPGSSIAAACLCVAALVIATEVIIAGAIVIAAASIFGQAHMGHTERALGQICLVRQRKEARSCTLACRATCEVQYILYRHLAGIKDRQRLYQSETCLWDDMVLMLMLLMRHGGHLTQGRGHLLGLEVMSLRCEVELTCHAVLLGRSVATLATRPLWLYSQAIVLRSAIWRTRELLPSAPTTSLAWILDPPCRCKVAKALLVLLWAPVTS